MKKIFLPTLFVIGLLLTNNVLFAQAGRPKMTEAQKDSAKAARKLIKDQKKAQQTTTTAVTPKPAPVTTTTTQPKVVKQGVNKSPDQAIGTDAKGRTIYQGPRGGQYTLSPNGNKEYIKKSN